MTSPLAYIAEERFCPRHARWIQLRDADTLRAEPPRNKRQKRAGEHYYTRTEKRRYRGSMETGCFTAAQRMSYPSMKGDLFQPELRPQQSAAPGVRASRNKTEQTKPELAQVVINSMTGRTYSKGKLLGKVQANDFFYMCSSVRKISIVLNFNSFKPRRHLGIVPRSQTTLRFFCVFVFLHNWGFGEMWKLSVIMSRLSRCVTNAGK